MLKNLYDDLSNIHVPARCATCLYHRDGDICSANKNSIVVTYCKDVDVCKPLPSGEWAVAFRNGWNLRLHRYIYRTSTEMEGDDG